MAEEVGRVLVAEDNPAMLGVVRYSLQEAGLEVTTAKNGMAAWTLLNETDFDLVVTDFNMPGMTGGELCECMRKNARLERVPIILLTARGFELDEAYFTDTLKVNALVPKPFSPRELRQVVQDLLAADVSSG